VNRNVGAEPFFSEPLPDAPWPVAERSLLSDREQSLYERLLSLYPHHKLFVQVALSQLIEVDRNHPESRSIRARYKQLVADFVLCRPDLSIVAVIELDDRSHENPKRQNADARKTKAVADAGIRLIRIPAGPLPSGNTLRALVEVARTVGPVVREETELRLAEIVDTYLVDTPMLGERREASAETRELKRIALKMIVGASFLVGGWFIFSQLVPLAIQQAFQPLAVEHERTSSPAPRSTAETAEPRPTAAAAERSAAEPPERRQVQIHATVLQKPKDLAWAAFHAASAACEQPLDWNAQVECGNQYMRAKKRFETQWAVEHGSAVEIPAAIVIEQ
jgi:hypothetical protein